jgi:probable rRNA maturation factor
MTISPTIRFHFLEKISLKDRQILKFTLRALFKKEGKKLAELQYIFCSDRRLLEINRQFLKHDYYTDIITFRLSAPNQPVTAEIYISVDRVRENAREFGNSVKNELLRVIFHGALHLCGYKDKTPKDQAMMRKKENAYVKSYFDSFPVEHFGNQK